MCVRLKIARIVDNQSFETASPLDTKIHDWKTKISNFGLCENLMVEVRLGSLNEHVQHLFAICQQISLDVLNLNQNSLWEKMMKMKDCRKLKKKQKKTLLRCWPSNKAILAWVRILTGWKPVIGLIALVAGTCKYFVKPVRPEGDTANSLYAGWDLKTLTNTWLTVHLKRLLYWNQRGICFFRYDVGSDCISSWSLLIFLLCSRNTMRNTHPLDGPCYPKTLG